MSRTPIILDWEAADAVTVDNLKNMCVILTRCILKSENYEQNVTDLNNIIKVLHFFGVDCDIHDFRAEAMDLTMEEYKKRMCFDAETFGY